METDRDIYKDMKESNIFDFTNYSPENEYYDDETNKLVPGKILIIHHIEYDVTLRIITGKFKDEMGGKAIEEFVGLRSKMYSIKGKDGEQKNTAKGVSKTVSENVLTHEDYVRCLMEKTTMKNKMTRFVHDKHQISTVDQVKTTLSPFNDKRFILEDGVSHSFGHWATKETELMDIYCESFSEL